MGVTQIVGTLPNRDISETFEVVSFSKEVEREREGGERFSSFRVSSDEHSIPYFSSFQVISIV